MGGAEIFGQPEEHQEPHRLGQEFCHRECPGFALGEDLAPAEAFDLFGRIMFDPREFGLADLAAFARVAVEPKPGSEEHTSDLQSLMRNSYDVFSLQQKNQQKYAIS